MKILYINSLYSPLIEGGAEISLQLIVEGMKARGHEVVVLSLMPEKGIKQDYVNGVKVYRAGLQNSYWPYSSGKKHAISRLAWHYRDESNLGMAAIAKQVLEIENPEIVACHNLAGWSVAVWEAIHSAGIPIIQVLHDLYLLCPNSNMFKNEQSCDKQCLSCKLLRVNHREKSKQVASVVGISANILQKFISYGYFENASKNIIYNTRTIENPPHLKERKDKTTLVYGYIGTLSKVKGLEWLLEQFIKLDFESTLKIAGKGEEEYEKHLRALSRGHTIELVGYVNSTDFMSEIDVLIVPSLWDEPLGMVAIEALANHIPVIANKRGGLQETVKDGVNGLYCYDVNPDSLSGAMRELHLSADKYMQFSKAARASVASILDKDRLVSQYEEVYKSVLTKLEKL